MIRKCAGVALLFALAAPLIALDRAPLICVMGGVATMSGVGHSLQHGMPHDAGASAHESNPHSTSHGKSHGCICPWECGTSRAPANVVHPWLLLNSAAERSPCLLARNRRPANPAVAFLPLTTGPPRSLRS